MKLALPDNETWKGQYKKIKLETNNLMNIDKKFLNKTLQNWTQQYV